MQNLKILMADDEPDVLEIMAKKIFVQGYTVITAKDGEEAWEKIQQESPDIILLDLNMPKMNGFEVLQRLRSTPPEEKWQPVIIISARNELDDVKKGLSLEAEYYLVKPCPIEDIIKAIRLMSGLISRHKTQSELGQGSIG
jgi:DNA-binding response OmpR family regulator